ncbi:hypothetical protein PO124_01140 [Bacillus licheniformis]|nr:hypothetical protein [Bacillus licheniformis]
MKTSVNRQTDQRTLRNPARHRRRGMANVYLALDIILDREVAIKVLRFDFVHDADLSGGSDGKRSPLQASTTRISSAFMMSEKKMTSIIS